MRGAQPAWFGPVGVMAAPASTVPVAHVLGVLRHRWKLLLSLVLLSALAGLVAALVIPRRYEAEVVALPRGTDRSPLLNSLSGQLGGLAALAGLGAGESGQRAEAVQMLQSHVLAREFIQDNTLLPVLFAADWDERRRGWSGHTRTLNDAVEVFDHRVRGVIEDRRTGLVTVRITWKDPVQAASWANEIVRRANDHLRRRAVARAQGAIEYLKREARNAEAVEVQQTLYRLMEEQYKNLLLANVSDDYAFSVIDPAVAADPDQYVFPRRGLFAFGGLFFGVVLVLMLVFIEASQRPVQANEGSQVR
jgi:uncharacterized protein involved in exopolysaccharide biosynthesis